MRKYVWLLLVLASLSVGCGSSTDVNQQKNALLARDREWSQTAGDMDKFLSYYTADASVYPQGMPVATGTQAIHDALTKMSSMPGFMLQWTAVKAEVSASGDLGYTAGSYQMTMNDASGKPVTDKGKYVTVWKKQPDGQWKVTDDIFNADAPPPAPEPPAAAKGKKAAAKRPPARRARKK